MPWFRRWLDRRKKQRARNGGVVGDQTCLNVLDFAEEQYMRSQPGSQLVLSPLGLAFKRDNPTVPDAWIVDFGGAYVEPIAKRARREWSAQKRKQRRAVRDGW